jgi:ATP-binding cassette subfamily G (WHITE) protein 2 (SNQ2)
LVYFFIYTVREKGWSFGFGALFRVLGKGLDMLKKPFKGMGKSKRTEE